VSNDNLPQGRQLAVSVLVSVLAMLCIAGTCVGVVSYMLDGVEDVSKVNRDGISCVIEELNAHRQNSYQADEQDAMHHDKTLTVPAPAPQPVPKELVEACDRFLTTP
jgi:hypothetical protein